MADEVKYQSHETKVEEPCDAPDASVKVVDPAPVETSDRGFFGFGKKKEEKKSEEEAIATEFDEKVQVSCEEEKKPHETKHEEKKQETEHESILQKLQRSSSSSSSSSDEEVDENGEKKKKKKGLKNKILGEEKEKPAEIKHEDTSVPIEKCDDVATHEPEAEKKGLLDKIKDKLPGGKKAEVVDAPPPAAEYHAEPEGEKKGFLDKIKEKIPGYHPKTVEEKEKDKVQKEGAC